jgi:hypothetical protein
MKPAELGMLADHMGHSVNIHMDIYKLQSNLLERSKVAKLLCAVDNGKLGAFQEERSLDEAVGGLSIGSYADVEGECNSRRRSEITINSFILIFCVVTTCNRWQHPVAAR